MNDVMRQRLLGILVLVALASILLPLLLDFDTGEAVDTRSRLPPAPEIRPPSLPRLGESEPGLDEPGESPEAMEPAAPVAAGNPIAVVEPMEKSREKVAEPSPSAPPASRQVEGSSQVKPDAPKPAAKPAAPFALPEPDPARSDASSVPQAPPLDAQGMPRAWVLQMGAFGERKNALELRDRLIAAGHRAFVPPARPGQQPPHRVFVGPKSTREQLVAEQRELERKFGIKPMVVPFVP